MKMTETEFIECLSKDLEDLIIKYIHSPDVYYQELPSIYINSMKVIVCT